MNSANIKRPFLSASSQHPIVHEALMEAYSEMLSEKGFFVDVEVTKKSIERVGPLQWEVKAANHYSFIFSGEAKPFLSGKFETLILVTCDSDAIIDRVELKETYFPKSIQVLKKTLNFEKLVSGFGEPEGSVFFELINTLKFKEYGVSMMVNSEDGLGKLTWVEYLNDFPIIIEELHVIG